MESEARRKKIASDRMALLTGRIHHDPDLIKASSFSDPYRDHLPFPQHARTSSEPVVPELGKPFFQDHLHVGDDAPDTHTSHENYSEAPEESALIVKPTPSSAHKRPEDRLSSITPREIHLGIVSSETTRAICSIAIALLVVLSHSNIPHRVVKSEILIAYRPLYAVLLTDLLVVAARLALFARRREEEEGKKKERDLHNWDGAVKLLEWGVMLHQTLRAVFIDCSVYLAIVICGLSLAH